ncbi:MAG: hypothetical protein ABR514_04845, partial [Chthoniobacterales bacterium]
CALEEGVGWTDVEKAVHLQGPELLHRKYERLYHEYDKDLLEQAQRELPYIDVYAAAAMYYIAGNWPGHHDVPWERAGANLRSDLSKIALRAHEWMLQAAHARLVELVDALTASSTSTGDTPTSGGER